MMIDWIGYLFGGIFYLTSAAFRRKKEREWEKQSVMLRIYEIGMWVTIPLASLSLIAIALTTQ